jgi:hypothetical protein
VSLHRSILALALSAFAAGAVRGAGRLIERRELARDRRHVVALTELASAAGGLTLATAREHLRQGAKAAADAGSARLALRPRGDPAAASRARPL